MEVGSLFFEFEPFRTASGPSRRVRERFHEDGVFTRQRRRDGVSATSRHRDAIDATARESTDRVERPRRPAQGKVGYSAFKAATEEKPPAEEPDLLKPADFEKRLRDVREARESDLREASNTERQEDSLSELGADLSSKV